MTTPNGSNEPIDSLERYDPVAATFSLAGATAVNRSMHRAVTLADKLPVKISAPDLCGRFSGRVIRGVNAHAATPAWMVQRLERIVERADLEPGGLADSVGNPRERLAGIVEGARDIVERRKQGAAGEHGRAAQFQGDDAAG